MALLHRIVDSLGAAVMGPDAWRRAQFKRAKKIARRQGYEIYKPQLIWFEDPDYLRAKGEADRLAIIGIPSDRCYMLLEMARHVRDVPGDVAECGTRYGKSSLFILTGLGQPSGKQFEIFDSFEGLSTPGQGDRDEKGEISWTPGDLAVPEDIVRNNLHAFADRIHLHKGWIPARFGDVADRKFAFVHVDVDLYEPTRDSVAFFYPRTSSGGVIICDDYGSAYCPGAKKAFDEFFADKPEQIISLPTGQALVIKQ
jgi:hypothetical protein